MYSKISKIGTKKRCENSCRIHSGFAEVCILLFLMRPSDMEDLR